MRGGAHETPRPSAGWVSPFKRGSSGKRHTSHIFGLRCWRPPVRTGMDGMVLQRLVAGRGGRVSEGPEPSPGLLPARARMAECCSTSVISTRARERMRAGDAAGRCPRGRAWPGAGGARQGRHADAVAHFERAIALSRSLARPTTASRSHCARSTAATRLVPHSSSIAPTAHDGQRSTTRCPHACRPFATTHVPSCFAACDWPRPAISRAPSKRTKPLSHAIRRSRKRTPI